MTIVSISCIAAEAPPQEGNMLEKSSKFLKIVLDIGEEICYYNKARGRSALKLCPFAYCDDPGDCVIRR